MSVIFFTDDAKTLLNEFDKHIRQTGKVGKVTTWEKTTKGYTHTSQQWHKEAFFKATATLGSCYLQFFNRV